jgi:endonuclease III
MTHLVAKAQRIYALLIEHLGEPRLKDPLDPLSELVLTILSQNTADTNSGRAYHALRSHFSTWDVVRTAPTAEVAESIRIGGLANIKAPRIQAILRQLYAERGRLDLDFLGDMSVNEARTYLTSLKGVGVKTASCVLLFALNKPAFPVDTHVHRVTRRLGLAPAKATPEQISPLMEKLVSPSAYYAFHVNLIRHGRTLCKASNPHCEACFLASECDYVNLNRPIPAPISSREDASS